MGLTATVITPHSSEGLKENVCVRVRERDRMQQACATPQQEPITFIEIHLNFPFLILRGPLRIHRKTQ